MKSENAKVVLIACVIIFAASGLAFGQDSVALSVSPSALAAVESGGIANGQKLKVEGIVINRNDQSFTVRDAKGTETVVVVTGKTVIKKESGGWFQRDSASSGDDIRCGLRLKVDGRGNNEGQLVAKKITIEPDLKTAIALESPVRPFKEFANSTQDQMWITETERRLGQVLPIGATFCPSLTIKHCGNYRPSCAEDCGATGCPSRDECNR